MEPGKSLKIWADACETAGICWSVYKETLLCAKGYHSLPESVACPQVAVFGKDLPKLMEQVFPKLPEQWVLEKVSFGTDDRSLYFSQEGEPVLVLNVLYGVSGEKALETAKEQVRKIAKDLHRRNWRHNLQIKLFGQAYLKLFGGLAAKGIEKIAEETFPKVAAFAAGYNEDAPFYSDIFTDKEEVVFPSAGVAQTVMLPCGDAQYPAFSGYEEYLTAVYGDYENGLADEIGCGLTAEEKLELKNHQAHCLQALEFIQSISEEFGLRYYLLAGSVLGAVRHGGFIPWDDDVDLGIRIEDLARFEEVVKQELPKRLPEGFALMQSGPNNPYPRMFSKICYEGRCCMDLWPLVPTYISGFRASALWCFAKIITKVHYYKIGHPVTRFLKIVKPMSVVLTDKTVMALARHNERKYAHRKTPAYINLYSIYTRQKETIRREWLDTDTRMEFNGLTVPVVGCTEEYLTHMYGDFTWFPPPWKRASRHSARFQTGSGELPEEE